MSSSYKSHKSYILYKNPEQYDTLAIVQYLHYLGKPLTPTVCIERSYPKWVTELPTICTADNRAFAGYEEVIGFYETFSGIKNIQKLANEFKRNNPGYRIHQ